MSEEVPWTSSFTSRRSSLTSFTDCCGVWSAFIFRESSSNALRSCSRSSSSSSSFLICSSRSRSISCSMSAWISCVTSRPTAATCVVLNTCIINSRELLRFSFRLRWSHDDSCCRRWDSSSIGVTSMLSCETQSVRIPRCRQQWITSSKGKFSTPIENNSMSSFFILRMASRRLTRSSASGPKGARDMNLQSSCSCGRDNFQRGSSSAKMRRNFVISSLEMLEISPFFNFNRKASRSAAPTLRSAHSVFFLMSTTISSKVSCRNLAYSIRALVSRIRLLALSDLLSNEDGNMLGNMAKATGSSSSRKGTIMKMEKGTIRNMSATVWFNCRRSARDNSFPPTTCRTSPYATLTSHANWRDPCHRCWKKCFMLWYMLTGWNDFMDNARDCRVRELDWTAGIPRVDMQWARRWGR
mmetsp:Transcript_96634/g.166567  ORF Transcript_96634/g.166567 Transcript_96634/m.166567 type:complete len:412 (+) Transcript_96634:1160-2395(+)